MPHHFETRNLPFTPDQLFDLVAGIERYPEFLPWCAGARILEREGDHVTADLIVGYKMFQEKFTSDVTLDRPCSVIVKYKAGPLSHLTNEWRFEPDGKGGCNLSFDVDFGFTSPLLQTIIEPFFDTTILKMVEAFEKRAHELYG